MKLTPRLPDDRRAHAEGRLRANLTASVTTVRPDGRPGSVPAWFLLRDDETILICSQPAKIKLRNISRNPAVAPGLDEERCERRRPRGRPCRRPPLRNDLEPARVVEADADCSVRPPAPPIASRSIPGLRHAIRLVMVCPLRCYVVHA